MATASLARNRVRPMNVHVRRGSPAEAKYRALAGVPGLQPEVIAPGLAPTPAHDLLFHGGKTIAQLTYTNFYLGGAAWQQNDIDRIDGALAAAMSESTLNNVMAQYFQGVPVATFKPSQRLPGSAAARMSQGDVENLVRTLLGQGSLSAGDLSSTVFNFMLPSGVVLTDNPAPGGAQAEASVRRGVPQEDESDSLHGLGGYHGSIIDGGRTVYYAVGVYSETKAGQTNGIPAFDAPWKSVVATFYHELNEARTDPDVQQVILGGSASLLGWTSRQGEECGDFPVFEANPLDLVFQEVPVVGGTAPVQFQYSNFVHGPEGPVATPRPPSGHRGKHSH
jgi:hypothetical protein